MNKIKPLIFVALIIIVCVVCLMFSDFFYSLINEKTTLPIITKDKANDLALDAVVKAEFTKLPKYCLGWIVSEEGANSITYEVWEGLSETTPYDPTCHYESITPNPPVIEATVDLITGEVIIK